MRIQLRVCVSATSATLKHCLGASFQHLQGKQNTILKNKYSVESKILGSPLPSRQTGPRSLEPNTLSYIKRHWLQLISCLLCKFSMGRLCGMLLVLSRCNVQRRLWPERRGGYIDELQHPLANDSLLSDATCQSVRDYTHEHFQETNRETISDEIMRRGSSTGSIGISPPANGIKLCNIKNCW